MEALHLDFSKVTHAYPNGMIPLICTLDLLKREGVSVSVTLPSQNNPRWLFSVSNWAHLMSPDRFPAEKTANDRHLVAKRFNAASEQNSVVNEFLDVVLRNMEVSRSVIAGLEWSVNEITDNVLNHADCPDGGLIQVTTYPDNHRVVFAVGDSGRGILASLSEGMPDLETDSQAIGEAVKAGVTRSPQAGQGNGLAGTLRVATTSGGGFALTSGRGHLGVYGGNTDQRQRLRWCDFRGTLVCAEMGTDHAFKIEDALGFDCPSGHVPVDIIETNYECDDGTAFELRLCDETTGFGNRPSGKQLRTKTLNILAADTSKPIRVDWTGVPVVSSSFADEFIGKLFLELGAMTFTARVRNVGMESLVRSLLDRAVAQRLQQANDEWD
ncbi:MAG: DUF4325 domain-containing protein [Actinobacteria bacterium]|nr:DUF4325 domain-containing protein [Actinomycetota bacterium]MCG2807322.1 DUF4325 domain-containing protein [Coriobacteriia bacterium]